MSRSANRKDRLCWQFEDYFPGVDGFNYDELKAMCTGRGIVLEPDILAKEANLRANKAKARKSKQAADWNGLCRRLHTRLVDAKQREEAERRTSAEVAEEMGACGGTMRRRLATAELAAGDVGRFDSRRLLTDNPTAQKFAQHVDVHAKNWELGQRELASRTSIKTCTCCNETKPKFLMSMASKDRGGEEGAPICARCARRNESERAFGFSRFSGSEDYSSAGVNLANYSADPATHVADKAKAHNDAWLRDVNRKEPEFLGPDSNKPGERNPFYKKDCPFKECTDAEIALVRKSIPCIELKMLKCGGTISKTHSVCVPNKVDVVTEFPRSASNCGLIRYVKKGKATQGRVWTVRRQKVRELYEWLKLNNKAYADTTWSEAAERAAFGSPSRSASPSDPIVLDLPLVEHAQREDDADLGPAREQLGVAPEDGETASGFVAAVPSVDVEAAIQAALTRAAARTRPGDAPPASTAPTLHVQGGPDALSEFDAGYYSAAFPEIFLDGSGELNRERTMELSEGEWLEHLMWTGDGRAARHKVFCFVAWSMLQRHQCLSQGSVYVSSNFGDEPVSVEELRDQLGRGDQSVARSVFYWGANIRGSDAYMHGLKKEIDALIAHQIHKHGRLPSLFITLSCAEFYWKVLLDLLAEFIDVVEKPPDGKPDLHNDAALRFKKLQEYAHVVTLYFEQRALAFIKEVLTEALALAHYYAVFEFAKSRGQIHVHLIAWCKDGEPHHLMHKAAPQDLAEDNVAAAVAEEPLFEGRQDDAALLERLGAALRSGDRAAAEAAWAEEVWATARAGGAPAEAAWRRAADARQVKCEPPPDAVSGGGEAAVAEWKAALLGQWMEDRGFSAKHPAGDDPASWPKPEGAREPLGPAESPLHVLRLTVDPEGPAHRQLINTHDFCKLHRCSAYCLRLLRHPPKGARREERHCSKGGFGPEAPLLRHDVDVVSGEHAGKTLLADSYTTEPTVCGGRGAYRCKLRADEAAVRAADGRLIIVRFDQVQHAASCRMPGCTGAPAFGKPRRARAAIVVDTERGIDSVELARDHPRIVQGVQVLTDWWLANDDHRVILSRAAPAQCTPADLAHVARYVSSYLTKGNEGSEEYARAFEQLLKDAPDDASTKTLVRRLLIRTIGKDWPRQQLLYLLAGNGRSSGCLKHTDVTFQRLSLSARRLDQTGRGGSATSSNAKDRYCQAVARDNFPGSLYDFLCTAPDGSERVPLISGGQTWATDPLTEQYAKNMLLLHYPGWTREADITERLAGESWLERFEAFRQAGLCPRFVEAEIARAALKAAPSQFAAPGGAHGGEEEEEHAEVQPEWMELLGHAEYTDDQLSTSFDDWTGRGHDHCRPFDAAASAGYPDLAAAAKWLQEQAEAEVAARAKDLRLQLPTEDPRDANRGQRLPIALLLHALYCQVEGVDSHLGVAFEPRRLLMLGKPGVGKSFVCKVLILLTRMVLGVRDAAGGGAPTGVAAFEAGLKTWHSLLKIPTGAQFCKSFEGVGAPKEVQDELARLFLLVGDELSMTGRTLFGWIAHRVRTGIARGAGSDEPFGGAKLPFAIMCGDFHQLDPVFDAPLYKSDPRNANSNYGRQAYLLFDEVVALDEVVRQKPSQVRLRRLLDSMRAGAGEEGYDMAFVRERRLHALPPAERSLFEGEGQGTLWVFHTWDKAWERNKAVLTRLNARVPVVRCQARNVGPHAKKAAGEEFASLPPCVFLAVRLQVRLTVNLFGDVGISWGLVNGALGTVVDILYAPGTQPSPATLPHVVLVRFRRYRGPAWFAGDPLVVPVPVVSRPGDCKSCGCKRVGVPLKEAEAGTIHGSQGLTVGEAKAVPRMVIDLGDKKQEARCRGGAYVAQSRPETEADFAYARPVTLERLTAIGSGKPAELLRAELEGLAARAANTAAKYAALVEDAHFEALLRWAEARAAANQIVPPYLAPAPPAAAAPTAATAAPAAATAAASRFFAPPAPMAADPSLQCMECDAGADGGGGAAEDMAVEPPILATQAVVDWESTRRGAGRPAAPRPALEDAAAAKRARHIQEDAL